MGGRCTIVKMKDEDCREGGGCPRRDGLKTERVGELGGKNANE